MLKEDFDLNNHPLKIWRNEDVKWLLIDFFNQNFLKAWIKDWLAEYYIRKIWEQRFTWNFEYSRKVGENLMNQAKDKLLKKTDEYNPLDLINYDWVWVYLDIWANKLSTINYLAYKFHNNIKFIAVDVIPQKIDFIYPDKSIYYTIDSDINLLPINSESIDLINLQFVLHHFPNLEFIKELLKFCFKVLKKNWRLILWEESFSKIFDSLLINFNNDNYWIKSDYILTRKFYDLEYKKRWEFIITNDWLINVSNPHIQWTGQYYIWDDWIKLLNKYNFILEKDYNLGLRINWRLKQWVHMIWEFKKL